MLTLDMLLKQLCEADDSLLILLDIDFNSFRWVCLPHIAEWGFAVKVLYSSSGATIFFSY